MTWSTPRTWTAGETVTAAMLNQHIRDQLNVIGDPWGTYSNTLGNWTIGNGTFTSVFMQAGKWVRFRIQLVAGSTTTFSGSPSFQLPVAAIGSRTVAANVLLYDSSAGTATGFWVGFAFNNTTTSLLLRSNPNTALSSTSPFTWATGDEVLVYGDFEAA